MRVFRELLSGPSTTPESPRFRSSFAGIGRKLGVDPDTVRLRVKKLHDSGLIAGWRTILNPSLLGGGEVAIWFDADPLTPKDELVEKIKLVQGVRFVSSFHGTLVSIILRYYDESSLPRDLELIRRIADVKSVTAAVIPFPQCRISLSKTDWEVLRALRRNPWKSLVLVSRELGLSSRTIQRKLDRLVREGALFSFPALNPMALKGSVLAALLVTYPGDQKQEVDARLAAHLEPYLFLVLHMTPFSAGELTPCVLNLALPNIPTAREIQIWSRSVPGVVSARIEMYEQMNALFETLDEDMENRTGLAVSSRGAAGQIHRAATRPTMSETATTRGLGR